MLIVTPTPFIPFIPDPFYSYFLIKPESVKLERYWFEFVKEKGAKLPMGTRIGCGVTATSEKDAIEILKSKIFSDSDVPAIKEVLRNVQFDELDQNHVIPNMGNSAVRGVWFPLGYE